MDYSKIIGLLFRTQEEVHRIGISDIFRIGLVREMILASYLGHEF